MEAEIVNRLVLINREFYQQFAAEFNATRQRLQPGADRLLDEIAGASRILDLGCGNGKLWRALHVREFPGEYVGLDFSRRLVEIAGDDLPPGAQADFLERDLSQPGWEEEMGAAFDCAVAFAVFHHLPAPLHAGILKRIHSLLAPRGTLVLSNWQFLNSPRWRARIQDWQTLGLNPSALDENDFLLDWRRGGKGFRYIHHFSIDELRTLARRTGFTIEESFSSDGKEGNLALYQIWQAQPAGRLTR